MNWLAHLHLAAIARVEPAGSLLPDIINTRHLADFSPQRQQAIRLHQAIDRFTDQHPHFKHSKQYLAPTYRKVAGVLVDIFYDYCLVQCWQDYAPETLATFVERNHLALQAQLPSLPAASQTVLHYMMQQQWLLAYGSHAGIHTSLERLSRRLQGRVDLAPASAWLQRHESGFMADFQAFYPDLLAYVRAFNPEPLYGGGKPTETSEDGQFANLDTFR